MNRQKTCHILLFCIHCFSKEENKERETKQKKAIFGKWSQELRFSVLEEENKEGVRNYVCSIFTWD